MTSRPLSLADQVCLAVVAEAPTHGWSIVRQLRPDGDLGNIWSLSRPLTYRSVDRLVDAGLVTRTDGGRRNELAATTEGHLRSQSWLDEPVGHLRQLRTEFLLKLRLRERRGLPLHELARRQLDALTPAIRSLTERQAVDPVDRWRQESAIAADRFLRHLVETGPAD